jgi:L-malate glycosyltransferase
MVTFQKMSEHPRSLSTQEPLRVLHVVSGDLWAGAEVQVWQLLRAAQKIHGLDLHAVVLNPGLLAERLAADGVPVTVFDESSHSFLQLAGELRRLARHWRPAVIHTHRRKEHLLGVLAARACGAALVGTVHGRSEFAVSQLDLRQRILRSVERGILARAHDRLVAVSDDLADELPGGPGHAVIIPNSVDVQAIRGAAIAGEPGLGLEGRIPIGFLGRLVPVKQIERMLEMMALLETEHPGRFALHIVGDGPLKNALQGDARRLGLEKLVVFHGFQSEPLPLLARLQAFLFASAHEGLPMTALEALSLGVPLVSPPIGSLSRLIAESGAGRVAASAAPRDLADAVLGMSLETADNQALRPSLLPERYGIEQGLQATAGLWREVAGRNDS